MTSVGKLLTLVFSHSLPKLLFDSVTQYDRKGINYCLNYLSYHILHTFISAWK